MSSAAIGDRLTAAGGLPPPAPSSRLQVAIPPPANATPLDEAAQQRMLDESAGRSQEQREMRGDTLTIASDRRENWMN